MSLLRAMLAVCLLAAAPASAGEAAPGEARAALTDSAWAFVHWQEAAGTAAADFGVTPPQLATRYVYAGEDGARNLIATAEPETVNLQLEGSGWRSRTAAGEEILTRNAAHEVAHLFQYSLGPALEAQWLHEGFADALAHEALDARGQAAGWGGGERCAEVLERGPIDRAQRAGEHNAIYDCSSLAIRAVADAREESVRDLYTAFVDGGGTDAAFLDLAGEAGERHRRSVNAFLTRDWRHARPVWVIRSLRAGRL